ncbi:MAG: metal ABC transporter permease [Planctomycetota bacterium]|nr:metal ABC transporter permease [Planctomycetota bacterium]
MDFPGVLANATSSQFLSEMARFWSFQDGSVRTSAAAMLLLGVSCGSLGCFVVLRRLSLVGDSLGHAVLPGVCLGFMVTWSKNPLWLFVGATATATIASLLIGTIQRNTRLKPDVAMGLVLSGFFGVGLMLLSLIQNDSRGGQGGLNQFFFGQAAAISANDLMLIAGVTAVIVAGVVVTFKELAVSSFDEGFAASLGLPTRRIHYFLMALTGMAIVISIQAVGVVLLSALLITPAATALLLTDKLPRMVMLSVLFAAFAGIVGLNVSSLSAEVLNGFLDVVLTQVGRSGLELSASRMSTSPPTGPVVVLILAMTFLTALVFSPRYGVATKLFRRCMRVRAARAGMEGASE